MMWGYQESWWPMWLLMGAVVIALWALVVVAVVALVRGTGPRRTTPETLQAPPTPERR